MERLKYPTYILGVLIFGFFLIHRLSAKNGDVLNAQGIRADTANTIDQEFGYSKEVHLAAIQFARAIQRAIDDPENAVAIDPDMDRAMSCFRAIASSDDDTAFSIMQRLEGIVVNTWTRSRSYIKYNARLSGGTYSIIPPNLKMCDFK